MDVKIFSSKYIESHDRDFWGMVIQGLENKGYQVYNEVQPCDHAIILDGYFINPCAFENKTLFYISKAPYMLEGKVIFDTWANFLKEKLMVPVLKEYYTSMFDVALQHPAAIADNIVNFINEINQP